MGFYDRLISEEILSIHLILSNRVFLILSLPSMSYAFLAFILCLGFSKVLFMQIFFPFLLPVFFFLLTSVFIYIKYPIFNKPCNAYPTQFLLPSTIHFINKFEVHVFNISPFILQHKSIELG
jgi:hypothetical protein